MNNSPENDISRGKIETVLCAANRRSVLRPGRFLARNLVELFIKERYARNSGSQCVINHKFSRYTLSFFFFECINQFSIA